MTKIYLDDIIYKPQKYNYKRINWINITFFKSTWKDKLKVLCKNNEFYSMSLNQKQASNFKVSSFFYSFFIKCSNFLKKWVNLFKLKLKVRADDILFISDIKLEYTLASQIVNYYLVNNKSILYFYMYYLLII